MANEEEKKQKKEIAKWFLTNAPAGEIQYVAKDIRTVLGDDGIYEAAAAEAFPLYNKAHLLVLELPDRSGDVIITKYGEIDEGNFLDPRTAQVASVNHVKQASEGLCRWAPPSSLKISVDDSIFSVQSLTTAVCSVVLLDDPDFRTALDAELCKYVGDTYPKGTCSVYCTSGKDVEEPGANFEFVVVISASRLSPQNFCNGSWRAIWKLEFNDDTQLVELRGKMQVGAHYFEEGNVQLDTNNECKDSNNFQSPEDTAVSVTNTIRQHEAEYMASLEASYLNLPDTTFKDLRRKLPVTRTLFPWHNTMQFSVTRDIIKGLGIEK